MNYDEFTSDSYYLKEPETAHHALALCLVNEDRRFLDHYMRTTNKQSKRSLENLPYLITEFVILSEFQLFHYYNHLQVIKWHDLGLNPCRHNCY